MTKITEDWLTSPETQAVFAILQQAGFEAYCVGGCVRNALLGVPVADIDMATNARPETVMKLAENAGLRTIPTGIDHGTVTVISGDTPYEVTTYRRDVETDGRRAVVAYSDRIEKDAQRRDFTMNALYADADGVVHDPVDGLADLKARKVRFIGDADERLAEDHLRSLRFFRFHAWYGDPAEGIDAEGLAACAEHADRIPALSRERIGAEMSKLLAAPDPTPSVAAMAQTGVLIHVLSGADAGLLGPLVHFENGESADWRRRLAAIGGEDVTERLRLSKKDSRHLADLKQALAGDQGIAEIAYRHGTDLARSVVLLRAAQTQSPPSEDTDDQIANGISAEFPVAAADLMPALTGPQLGARLKELEQAWIASGFQLTRAELLAL